jgi:hypothetical protein
MAAVLAEPVSFDPGARDSVWEKEHRTLRYEQYSECSLSFGVFAPIGPGFSESGTV